MHHGNHDKEGAQKLYDLVKDVQICMFTTVDEDGTLRSRPMHNQTIDENGDFWFFTKVPSGKTAEIRKDQQVNLAFSNPSKQDYVSVSGTAEIIRDRAAIDKHWSEPLRTWFPEGKDDPAIGLIRVRPTSGEYWDSPSSTMLHLYGYVKAVVTGTPPKGGDEGKVNLR
ncbi:MAG TPA: pyridoxamine 5'-phosphate oxidase family protein [Salinarimonas sp.]|jgi:general stress protein 26|nr:pyridoxamine 5'-phosphate oxidase family protein [Salinarimonas sp.]